MNWVTVNNLQHDSGLSPAACEAIIREQTRLVRKGPGGPRILIATMYLCATLLAVGALDCLWPSLSHRWWLLLRALGLVLMVFSWFVLPRLLAGDAILAAARTHGAHISAGTATS